ncbi:MAG: porin [Cyclobacteriaceae bacterium]
MESKSFSFKILLASLFSIYFVNTSSSQSFSIDSFGKGIYIKAQDSSFSTKFGLRFQTLYSGMQDLQNQEWNESFLIRRYRLKFDGYVIDPKIVYKLELGLSNRDTRAGAIPESGETASIILDAAIKWNFAGNWVLWAGQTKLPGNRERVISSQNMQFVDRSMVNASFTLDRDIGLQLHHEFKINKLLIKHAVTISEGNGRNLIADNPKSGREYTGRLEFLPMGAFTNKGDYFGSDLIREPIPKLSIGITGDYNSKAARSRGNLGSFLVDTTGEATYLSSNLATLMIDGIFKYKGLSISSEYAHRDASDRKEGYGYGSGVFGALGYLFPSNFEIAGRYTQINPISSLSSISASKEYTLGFSWYIRDHDFKVQSDISHLTRDSSKFIVFRIQCELAI